MTEPLRMRTGRTVGRTLYHVHADGDELVGVVDTRALAAAIVAAVNATGRTPGPQELPDELLRALLRQVVAEEGLGVTEDMLLLHARTDTWRLVLKSAYRVGYAAALGYEVTVDEAGDRVVVGDRIEAADHG